MVVVYQQLLLERPFLAHHAFLGELPMHTFVLEHIQMEVFHLTHTNLFLVHHRLGMQRQRLRP